MKRSRNVRRPRFRKALPAATTLSVSVSLGLGGCSPPPQEAGIYRDAEECKQIYPDQTELCQQVFLSAQMDHLATAPRFDGLAQCEADFGAGNCEQAPESRLDPASGSDPASSSEQGSGSEQGFGGGWFMPMMMGYMMGNLMSGRSLNQRPVYSSSAPNSPIRDKLFTGDGQVVGNRGDRSVRVPQTAFNKPVTPARITRTGGFGTMAAQKARAGGFRGSSPGSSYRSYGG